MKSKPLPLHRPRNGHDLTRFAVNWGVVLAVLGAFVLGCVLTGGCFDTGRQLWRQSGR